MNIKEINNIKQESMGNFTNLANELLEYGVYRFITCAQTGKSMYFDYNNDCVYDEEDLFYNELGTLNIEGFIDNLAAHQRGEIDFMKWVNLTADCGIAMWEVDLNEATCSYKDIYENVVYKEQF